MKILLPKFVLVLLVVAFAAGSALGQGRIATIDLNKAFSNYWKRKEAEANFKDMQMDMEKEFQLMYCSKLTPRRNLTQECFES